MRSYGKEEYPIYELYGIDSHQEVSITGYQNPIDNIFQQIAKQSDRMAYFPPFIERKILKTKQYCQQWLTL